MMTLIMNRYYSNIVEYKPIVKLLPELSVKLQLNTGGTEGVTEIYIVYCLSFH